MKEDKSAADIPAKKPEKHIASGDAKVDPPSKLISMPPPAKKVTPPTYRKTEKSTDFGTPFEHVQAQEPRSLTYLQQNRTCR